MLRFYLCCTIFLLIVLRNIELIRSAECAYVDRSDGYQFIECENVPTMEDLAGQMDTTWTNLAIVNRPGVSFSISGECAIFS